MNKSRLSTVLANMRADGIRQMLVTDPIAIFYLTGRYIDPGERFLGIYLNCGGNHKIFINRLFAVPEELGIEKIWYSDAENSMGIVSGCTDHSSPLGVDKTLQARFLLPLMGQCAAASYVNASGYVDAARARKDEEEKARMRRASAINDRAMALLQKRIREGVSETELADELSGIYKTLGADGFSFEPIIAFGGNAAEGHHKADGTVLKEGDCVVVDIGCRKDGYCADMTRTFFYKRAEKRQREIYSTVLSANETAEALIRPGIRFCDLDGAARDVIEQAGYGNCFTHRLGHGIGLEVHEAGDVSSANTAAVQPGMTFSIEPGIYLEGEMGVRIEDLVLVNENGCEVLNRFPKQLTVLED